MDFPYVTTQEIHELQTMTNNKNGYFHASAFFFFYKDGRVPQKKNYSHRVVHRHFYSFMIYFVPLSLSLSLLGTV